MTALVLATPAQLRNHLGPNGAGITDPVAAQAIANASSLIRAVSRQQFDFVQGDVVTVEGGSRDLVVPQRPLVVDASNPLTVVAMDDLGQHPVTLTEGVHYRRLGDTLSIRYRSNWQPRIHAATGYAGRVQPWPLGVWAPLVKLTYSHGYPVCPDWLTTIALETAATYATNPAGLRSETVGQITLTYAQESLKAPHELVDTLRSKLAVVGVVRGGGGAFSIGVR